MLIDGIVKQLGCISPDEIQKENDDDILGGRKWEKRWNGWMRGWGGERGLQKLSSGQEKLGAKSALPIRMKLMNIVELGFGSWKEGRQKTERGWVGARSLWMDAKTWEEEQIVRVLLMVVVGDVGEVVVLAAVGKIHDSQEWRQRW